ncbi:PQQ-binding-like beta-propeller repeat protein [Haloechinothrix sp. LS1_15]|uniref:outer membrane protein assembly factor BamB family protein n=1 Tax=Haloechinothrix sp. LS1_15 TaxID=2652248 RepID=UPI00294B243D|nr:PQQ-binding-like beta-propeller repeat protein [Haloechinothrix sp. LS1_15]
MRSALQNHRTAVLSLAAGVAMLLAACSSDTATPEQEATDEDATPAERTPEQEPEFELFEPPTKFDEDAEVTIEGVLPDPRYMGGGATVAHFYELGEGDDVIYYSNSDGLRAHSAVRDTELWKVPTENAVTQTKNGNGVALGEIDGEPVVAGSFVTMTPGEGTVATQYHLEVIAVDAHTGDTRWHVVDDLAKRRLVTTAVAGVSDAGVVVGFDGTYGLDPADGSTRWTDEDMTPYFMDGGLVLGRNRSADPEEDMTRVVAADTGEERWRSNELSGTQPAGEGRLLVSHSYGSDGGPRGEVLDMATGTVEHEFAAPEVSGNMQGTTFRCAADHQDIAICWVRKHGHLAAYDLDSGESLWSMSPQATPDRRVPTSTDSGFALWHGALYSEFGVLDLRDGTDMELEPGIKPHATNGVIGVRMENRSLSAYPAIG